MSQLFPKKRRRNGYWIYFYADEYKPLGNKPLEKLHLHLSDKKEKWEIPKEEQTKIKKFVKKNYRDIMRRIEFYLKELGLKLK